MHGPFCEASQEELVLLSHGIDLPSDSPIFYNAGKRPKTPTQVPKPEHTAMFCNEAGVFSAHFKMHI
ncbi:hypothetical protein E2C01_012880 [Portunus trituberculatus]|uniref:Uncharacterized protein n=1 Tax=Portunus trituberculatus TaxID=210409 RepID=A0A5B7DF15_PORTR|nr:hypothetical protein [Portunus trituberculatus]